MDLRDPDLLRTRAFIGGDWCDTGATMAVDDPGRGEPFIRVASAGAVHAVASIDAAAAALPAWRSTTADERCAILHALHRLILEHQADLALILTHEHGKPLAQAMAEIRYAASFVKWFAEEGRRSYGDTIPSANPDQRLLVYRQGVGITVGITPWNFPSAMITRKLAPALAAGCTFCLKPAEQTPLSALALAVLAQRAGVPKGVFSVIPTSDAGSVAAPWLSDTRVRKLSFTGSTRVGKLLAEQCAPTLKRVSLELGGNAPFVVFEDADLDAAVDGLMVAKFRNAGQSCVAANRVLVHRAIQEVFVKKLCERLGELRPGHGLDEDSTLGPLIDEAALSKVERLVAQSKAAGATILAGGGRHAAGPRFFDATVVSEVTPAMSIAREEIFGPVVSVLPFEDESDAIRIANDTPFGLASYVYTRDLGRAWRVSEALEYGMVGVNTGLVSNTAAPFGGIKESGQGREGSRYGLEDWTELKYVAMGGLSRPL